MPSDRFNTATTLPPLRILRSVHLVPPLALPQLKVSSLDLSSLHLSFLDKIKWFYSHWLSQKPPLFHFNTKESEGVRVRERKKHLQPRPSAAVQRALSIHKAAATERARTLSNIFSMCRVTPLKDSIKSPFSSLKCHATRQEPNADAHRKTGQ